MRTIVLDKPLLSFKTDRIFLQQEDDLKYLILANGFTIGWLITRNGYAIVPNGEQEIIQSDKDYIIGEFLKLLNS